MMRLDCDSLSFLGQRYPEYALDTLRFSAGYALFAAYYAKGGSPTTPMRLLKGLKWDLVRELFEKVRRAKRGELVTPNEAGNYLERWSVELAVHLSHNSMKQFTLSPTS